jgi:hypothetical protein
MAFEGQAYIAFMDATKEEDVRRTIKMFYRMWQISGITEAAYRAANKTKAAIIDGCLGFAINNVNAFVGKGHQSNLFTAVPEELWVQAASAYGPDPAKTLGNYMRVGMAAITNRFVKWNLGNPKNAEFMQEYIAARLVGDKPYPRMVWPDGDLPMWLMLHGQMDAAISCRHVHVGKWDPMGAAKSIQSILSEWRQKFFQEDPFGRPKELFKLKIDREGKPMLDHERKPLKRDDYIKGEELLNEYKLLTRERNTNPLHQYHFDHFWSILLRDVSKHKKWDQYRQKEDDASEQKWVHEMKDRESYLMMKNVPIIVEELQPNVPSTEQGALTPPKVQALLDSTPPTPRQYQQVTQPAKRFPFDTVQFWRQMGFTQVTEQQVKQIATAKNKGDEAVSQAIKKANLLGPLMNSNGQRYRFEKAMGGGQIVSFIPMQ